jgi:predicted tellurium resistance membrane protein TerC
MSTGLANWREIGASVILACLNTLVTLTLICLGLFLMIAVSIMARGVRKNEPKTCPSAIRDGRLMSERPFRP